MELAARRYARKVLLIHLAALLVVVAIVGLAVKYLYDSARQQAIAHAADTQRLLAKQAALGISNYYEAVTGVMDLLQPTDADNTVEPPRPNRPNNNNSRGPNAQELRHRALQSGPLRRMVSSLGEGMWQSIQDKATMMFVVDSENDCDIVASVGDRDQQLDPPEIVAAIKPWLATVKHRSVSQYVSLRSGGAHVVAVPMRGPGGLVMLCVVPVASLERDVLRFINQDSNTRIAVVDSELRVVYSPDPNLRGRKVEEFGDDRMIEIAQRYQKLSQGGTEIFDHQRTFNGKTLQPAIVTPQPAKIFDEPWQIIIASDLTSVDAIVTPVFRDAMLWAGFVMLAMTTILVSTAIQLIRTRLKLERQQMERLNKELEQARQIQLNWLPRQPTDFKLIDIAAINKPASHVSGDFYNWFELPDGRYAIAIGDVTGHGMAAAFLMATTQFLLRALMQRVPDPGRVLTETNRQLNTMVFSGQFVTTLLMILDPQRRELLFANAGHFQPLVWKNGRCEVCSHETDLVLGVDPNQHYITHKITLDPDSRLLLYTDGVVEAQSLTGDRLQTPGLIQRVNGSDSGPKELVDTVVNIVTDFTAGRDLEDDLTLVAVQLRG
jgi:serine phosphatase RsbU (regulator of sigma subunit)